MRLSGNSSLGKINDRAFFENASLLGYAAATHRMPFNTSKVCFSLLSHSIHTERHYAGAGISKEGLFLSLMEKMSSNTSIS